MAKGQVTNEDLVTGIKSFGGLSSLGGVARPVRDNPYRDTRTDLAPPAPDPVLAEPEPVRIEVVQSREDQPGEGSANPPAPQKSPGRKPAGERVAKQSDLLPRSTTTHELATPAENQDASLTDRVTLPLSPALRDRADALAKSVQRRRTHKRGERITTNTIIRVGLRAMLDAFESAPPAGVNQEEELYELICRRLRK